jgi:hypothetical protein
MSHEDADAVFKTNLRLDDIQQNNEMRISMHQYQDDCYWHRGQRACCSIRRVCTYVAIILSQLRPAVNETTRFIVMTTLLRGALPHLAVTCVVTESCSQVIRCITF